MVVKVRAAPGVTKPRKTTMKPTGVAPWLAVAVGFCVLIPALAAGAPHPLRQRPRLSPLEGMGETDGSWVRFLPDGVLPSGRPDHAAIYDPVRDRMVVFGGGTYPNYRNDVWSMSLAGEAAWTQLSPAGTLPRERIEHTAIYDPVRERMIVFGGLNNNAFNDVWALSMAGSPQWTQLAPAGTPPSPRLGHTAIYDPVGDRMVVFGGEGAGILNDVWALSLAGSPEWAQLTPAGTPPSPRFRHAAIYDPVRERIIVFGGEGEPLYNNDVWALSLVGSPEWTQLAPAGTPPSPRLDHTAIYDPVGDRMVVFGGAAAGIYLNDVWALSLAGSPEWTQLAPAGAAPSPRFRHAAIYDPVGDRMVVFGGDGAQGDKNDAWALAFRMAGISLESSAVTSEGNMGTTNVTLNVILSAATDHPITVNYQTGDGSATVANNDYIPTSGTLTFPANSVDPLSVVVEVFGDDTHESDETFSVRLSNAEGGVIVDDTGIVTIQNDDPIPTVTISDIGVTEGNSGMTEATLTMGLSNPTDQTVTVSYSTADGSATVANHDYQPVSSTLTIPPGSVGPQAITVQIVGDSKYEPDETFSVGPWSAMGAAIAEHRGIVTILNDDPPPRDTLAIGTAHLSAPTDSARLAVRFGGLDSLGYVALYFDFDGARLANPTVQSTVPGKEFFTNLVNGELLVGWFDATGGLDPILPTADTLFVVTFAHIGPFVDSTIVTLDATQCDIGNERGTPISDVLLRNGPPGGVVTSNIPNATVAGHVHYYLFDGAVPDAQFSLEPPNLAAVSDAAGAYAFAPQPLGNYTVHISKTTDFGGITSLDALKVVRHWARLEPFDNPLKLTAADVTGDGSVTLFDAVKITNAALGREMLASGDWKFVPPSRTVALDRDRLAEDFLAIRMGDVDGDWLPLSGSVATQSESVRESRHSSKASPSTNSAPRLMLPDTVVIAAADTVSVPLYVTAFDSVGAISLRISFSDHVLGFAGYTTNVSGLSVNRVGSEIRMEQYDQTGGSHPISMGSGTLLVLRFTVAGSDGDYSSLHFATTCAIGNPHGDRVTATTFSDGRVRVVTSLAVGPLQPLRFFLHSVRPNPAYLTAEVRYEIPSEDRAQVKRCVNDLRRRPSDWIG